MTEFIKKFDTADSVHNYTISDIPFVTSVATNPVQNLVCNKTGKKLINTEGIVSIYPPDNVTVLVLNDSTEVMMYDTVLRNIYQTYYNTLVSCFVGNNVTKIDNYAFQMCTHMISVNIPGSVEIIGYGAFKDCSGLETVILEKGIKSIHNVAFQSCRALKSITIPASVTDISTNAFNGCSGLTQIVVKSITPPSLGTNAFYNSTCPIYVPVESVETYKAASGWSTYASRIQAIPD